MSYLEAFRKLHPDEAPKVRFPNERALEAYMEVTLREILREGGVPYGLKRLPDGRFLGRVKGVEALSFSGWKALLKAYLRYRGVL